MELIVKEFGEISISDEMLKDVDMGELLIGFKSDYDKLDDIRKARARHETRNALSRWWNSDELEKEQLNAVELQSSFSKRLGQLMIVSIAQSKLITQQQAKLAEQQNDIRRQTEEIASANIKIKDQQNQLSEQQDNLENLIENYFELKGLTADGAQKLIAIAKEVEATKENMMNSFDQHRVSVDHLAQRFSQESEAIRTEFQEVASKQKEHVNEALRSVDAQLSDARQSVGQSISSVREFVQENYQKLTDLVDENNKNQAEIQKNFEQHIEAIVTKFTSEQSLVNHALKEQIASQKWVSLLGLVTSIAVFGTVVWLFYTASLQG